MPWHTVQQGEWMGSIAQQYHFYDWHTIYNDPQNADLRQKRPDPQMLYPGDQVFVPTLITGEQDCATDQLHKFVLKTPTSKLVIVVKDEDDQPITSKPYKLTLGKKVYSGTTDSDGKLEVEIPIDAPPGKVEVDGYIYDVHVGHLDPLDELMGIQKRLTNLGYDCSPIDGTMNDNTTAAITQFQAEVKLRATGALDDDTKKKLKEKYGC